MFWANWLNVPPRIYKSIEKTNVSSILRKNQIITFTPQNVKSEYIFNQIPWELIINSGKHHHSPAKFSDTNIAHKTFVLINGAFYMRSEYFSMIYLTWGPFSAHDAFNRLSRMQPISMVHFINSVPIKHNNCEKTCDIHAKLKQSFSLVQFFNIWSCHAP